MSWKGQRRETERHGSPSNIKHIFECEPFLSVNVLLTQVLEQS